MFVRYAYSYSVKYAYIQFSLMIYAFVRKQLYGTSTKSIWIRIW